MFVVVFYHKTKTLHGGALIHPPSMDILSTGTHTATKANDKTGLDGCLAEIGHQNYFYKFGQYCAWSQRAM